MARFVIIDMNNLVNRAVHVIKNAENQKDWVGRSYTIVFQSIAKITKKFVADHVVACFDSYSWREEIYKIYKENRRHDLSEKKIETKKFSHHILREFSDYLKNKTNISVLEGEGIEADDFIARWTQLHQHIFDSHIIISNDADFKQIVGPGVDLYDPIPGILYTSDGVYFQDEKRDLNHPTFQRYNETWKIKFTQPKTTLVYRYDWQTNRGQKGSFVYPINVYPNLKGLSIKEITGKDEPIKIIRIVGEQSGWEYFDKEWKKFPLLSEKTPLILSPEQYVRFIQKREIFDPRWELFIKCIRGDSRDNIRPSFPRVPETRLRKAFLDKNEYIKLINDTFGSGEKKQEVKPLFEMNKKLIDLTAQPDDIKNKMDNIIQSVISQKPKQMVEIYFDDFCKFYEMRKLREVKSNIIPALSRPYCGNCDK